MTLTVVADDLTGACDTGALFAGDVPVPVSFWPAAPPAAAVRVLDTESRAATGAEAAARVVRAPALAPAERYFKKIDSTLRGHVGIEIDALMRATASDSALVCPAFPAQGRVVVERVLLIDGTPLKETLLAGDPAFSGAASSSVVDVIRPHVNRPLAWIPLDQVRAGVERLAARLGRLSGTVTIADAENNSDLDALVDAALAANREPLLVGAAGLARALAARLGLLADEVLLPAGARWLLVAGSRHPASRAQVRAALDAGLRVVAAPEEEASDRRGVARSLAAKARALLAREAFDAIAVTGGETALALCETLGAEGIDLLGAPQPGLALGRLRGPAHPGLPILTKAGGFGDPDLFVSLLTPALVGRRES